MRKPRDVDAELRALNQRAKALKMRRITQLGELVIAAGADDLDLEVLTGALLCTASERTAKVLEDWRRCGTAFFREQGRSAGARRGAVEGGGGAATDCGPAAPR
jgi:DNA-binding protein H-NS